MVILGADLHKRSHTVVVIDTTGRKLAERRVAATPEGHLELRRWAAQWPDRTWALEDCRHLSRLLTTAIRALEREIEGLVRSLAGTLLALPGCGALTAAEVVGETAGVSRFRSKEAFARHNGTAPIPVWSGDTTRHRLSRGGNRQLNAALHRIAITQMRIDERGRAYIDHRRAAGDTKTEAIRALRRRISDEVLRRLQADEAARAGALAVAA